MSLRSLKTFPFLLCLYAGLSSAAELKGHLTAETTEDDNEAPAGSAIDPKVQSSFIDITTKAPIEMKGYPYDGKEYGATIEFFVKDGKAVVGDRAFRQFRPLLEHRLAKQGIQETGDYCWVTLMNVDADSKDKIKIPAGSKFKVRLGWGFGSRSEGGKTLAQYAWKINGQWAALPQDRKAGEFRGPGDVAGFECYGKNVTSQQIQQAFEAVFGQGKVQTTFHD